MKTYTNRSNCARAAKVALGKTAKPGIDFTVTKGEGGWTFKAIEKGVTRKRTKAPKGERASLLGQPQMQVVLGLMQRKTGCNVDEIMARINCGRDTARGMVSRIKTEGAPVTTTRESRFVRYNVAPEWAA